MSVQNSNVFFFMRLFHNTEHTGDTKVNPVLLATAFAASIPPSPSNSTNQWFVNTSVPHITCKWITTKTTKEVHFPKFNISIRPDHKLLKFCFTKISTVCVNEYPKEIN